MPVREFTHTRSSTSISLGDSHRTSSNSQVGRKEPYFFHDLWAALELMKEGLEVEEGKVELTIIVLVILIEKERIIIHGLGNSYVCQTVMPKKTNTSRKKSVTEDRFGA